MNETTFLSKYWATFEPSRDDDLRPAAAEAIGERLLVQDIGEIDDGPYQGQRQYLPVGPRGRYVGWIPACDLVDLEKCEDG